MTEFNFTNEHLIIIGVFFIIGWLVRGGYSRRE